MWHVINIAVKKEELDVHPNMSKSILNFVKLRFGWSCKIPISNALIALTD